MYVKSEPVVEDGPMAGNNNDNEKRPPWHENRDPLLRRLQKSVHFVKTVTSSNVGRQLAIPTWFVIKHGDKFEQTILLRSGILPVREPWHVRLSLSKRTLKSPQVILAGGWPKFVAVHGLAEGDDLLFSLRAMSEFDVYVFRKPPPPPDWSRGFDDEVPQRKTGGCTSEHSDEGVSTTTKEPYIGEDNGPIYAFRGRTKIGTCASTYDLHYLVQRDLHEPQCLHSDVSLILDRKNDGNPKASQEKAETKTTSPPSFRKRLTARNVGRGGSSLEIPRSFRRRAYTGGLHPPEVQLQGIHEHSQGRTVLCKLRKQGDDFRLYLTDGWREFGEENGLKLGQELVFTLTANSFFRVRKA